MTDIEKIIGESVAVKQRILENPELLQRINDFKSVVVDAYRRGGKVLFCGNGGSAADAQHIAAELSGRFYLDRKPLLQPNCREGSTSTASRCMPKLCIAILLI